MISKEIKATQRVIKYVRNHEDRAIHLDPLKSTEHFRVGKKEWSVLDISYVGVFNNVVDVIEVERVT